MSIIDLDSFFRIKLDDSIAFTDSVTSQCLGITCVQRRAQAAAAIFDYIILSSYKHN